MTIEIISQGVLELVAGGCLLFFGFTQIKRKRKVGKTKRRTEKVYRQFESKKKQKKDQKLKEKRKK